MDSSGLWRGVFLSLGVHALAALILAGGLAGSTPPRPIKGFDSCLHVDLVSPARAPAHPKPHPAPPEAVRRIKPVPTPVAAPAERRSWPPWRGACPSAMTGAAPGSAPEKTAPPRRRLRADRRGVKRQAGPRPPWRCPGIMRTPIRLIRACPVFGDMRGWSSWPWRCCPTARSGDSG